MNVDDTIWQQLPAQVEARAAACRDLAKQAQALLGCYPLPDETALTLGPDSELILVSDVPDERLQWLKTALSAEFGSAYLGCVPSRIWSDSDGDYVKLAYSPMIRGITDTMNLTPGKLFGTVPNMPGPVSSMLTSGLLGAGLGYGAGWLGEKLMPDNWRHGRLRKTLAMMGGAAGVLPGLTYGLTNVGKGVPFNDNSTLNHPPVGGVMPENHFPIAPLFKSAVESLRVKMAYDLADNSGMTGDIPPIQVDKFNQTIWGDPYVSPNIPLSTRGAATAGVTLAQQMPGGVGAGWVTPMQLGHIAAGMGVGYASGALVGGVLGLLTGMPDSAQDQLKRTGMYAGIVSQVVPMLFGN